MKVNFHYANGITKELFATTGMFSSLLVLGVRFCPGSNVYDISGYPNDPWMAVEIAEISEDKKDIWLDYVDNHY